MYKRFTATAALALAFLAGCSTDVAEPTAAPSVEATVEPTTAPTVEGSADGPLATADTFEYPGETGKTALELLEANADTVTVSGEGENAFVTEINGRTADDGAKEFWALAVDGTPAEVGAGALATETGQTITWSITTY